MLTGFGVGSYLRVGGSTGGMDIVATVVRKKLVIPVGTSYLTINILNLAGGIVLHSLAVALYSGIYMFVSAWMVDRMQAGFSEQRSVFIVTSEPQAVATGIMHGLGRGVIFIEATGAYGQQPTRLIYTVLSPRELPRLKDLLFTTVPKAFVAVHHTAEVIGKRFLSWEDQGYSHTRVPSAAA